MTSLVYVDSSVALALAFHENGWEDLRVSAHRHQSDGSELVSSELLRTEVRRVFFRHQRSFRGADRSVSWIALIEVTNAIIGQAGRISTHVRTLDAIHVAAAQSLQDERTTVRLWTLDDQMRRAATHVGLEVTDSS